MTSASDMATCSGVAGGLAAGQEKAAWYREQARQLRLKNDAEESQR